MDKQHQELMDALKAPFPADVVEWKPQATSANSALAIAYIDARAVMDRLDEAVGSAHWTDSYEVLADNNVVCTLSLRIDGEWVAKSDVGGESDQKDEGDRRKASFSDALKRAAVKWGIGRYLYKLDGQWVDYDKEKRKLLKTPTLPAWALPKPKADATASRILRDQLIARLHKAKNKDEMVTVGKDLMEKKTRLTESDYHEVVRAGAEARKKSNGAPDPEREAIQAE